MEKYIKHILVIGSLLIAAWWFRYDIECGGNAYMACVAYDRFTGNFILPIKESRR